MNIIKNRYLYFLISLLVIIPGIVFMTLHWTSTGEGPLALGIDFKGGSLLEVQFERHGTPPWGRVVPPPGAGTSTAASHGPVVHNVKAPGARCQWADGIPLARFGVLA